MKYSINCFSDNGTCEFSEEKITFTSNEDVQEAFFNMSITFPEWEDDCYILMPACAYNGNKIKRVKRVYPPKYRPEDAGVDCEQLIMDVPALNPDGSGEIQVTAGDMSVPCVGIFNRKKKEGFLIFTCQEVKRKNVGFTLKNSRLDISYPANRNDIYRFWNPRDTSGDVGIPVKKNEKIETEYKIFTFSCDGIAEFYKYFFELRKSVMSDKRPEFMYTKELWDLMEGYFNDKNWSGEYYSVGANTSIWASGWCGGGMSTYPLLKCGNETSKQRAAKTIDYLAKQQAESGFYYTKVNNGEIFDDRWKDEGIEHMHLIRRSADVLYFLFKEFEIVSPKKEWIESAKKCADAFVKLFCTYGKLGQFVNVKTGEMLVGASTNSAAIVSGALAKAAKFFKNEKYMEIAKKTLEQNFDVFLKTGITSGGPGEVLGAPDSESAFGLLESCITLYETDKDEKWLRYAETAAHYCSSWVVTYSYKFPEGTEFERLKINTVGSVFANVQNKHSAPGICTLSGDSLFKLYKYTQNSEYLELIKDIAYFIPQCVSTEDKPIYTWDVPPKKLPAGYINERVNMSDWERQKCVGGVFLASCWPETSLLLSFVELMIYDEMK